MLERISISSQHVFESLLPCPNTAVISITDPGEAVSIQRGWGRVLQVAFVDGGYDESVIRAFGPGFCYAYGDYMHRAEALQIRQFIEVMSDNAVIAHLHVHCKAGKSRSAAVACFAANRLGVTVEGDTSKRNDSVLLLLNDPWYFDNVIAECEATSSEMRQPDLWSTAQSAFRSGRRKL